MDAAKWYTLEPGLSAIFHLTESGDYFGTNGSSRDISNAVDLAHLLKLRSVADAIVVGGETSRVEKYFPSNRFETYVFSRRPQPDGLHRLEFSDNRDLTEQLMDLKAQHKRLLSECGPTLLNRLLDLSVIDVLFLTVTFRAKPNTSVAEQIARRALWLDGYQLDQYELIQNSMVSAWRRA